MKFQFLLRLNKHKYSTMMKRLHILIALLFMGISSFSQISTATYSINYTSTWSNTTHPHPTNNFPAGAHYSKLVGATHNTDVVFLEMGQLASPGVEDIAELGSNTVFFNEVTTAINNGDANQIIDGDALNTSEGEIVINDVVTSNEFPYITLLSMIAPSPDWMVAVNSVELLDGGGDWKDSITMDLFPYDAGTDSGTDYNSPNMDTNPADPISSAQGVPPFSNMKMGTLTITLEDVVLSVDETTTGSFELYPNPTSGIINIAAVNNISTIEVYNVLGALIMTAAPNSNQAKLDLSSFGSGVYMVKLNTTDGATAVKKVVKR